MILKRVAPAILMVLIIIVFEITAAHSNASAVPGASPANVSWVKFTDPLEQAFTLDVPQGWTVKGGMFRLGYSDHRQMVDITSPDGKINIRLGDISIPPYFVPNQSHREGEVYDLGAQAQGRVARYRTGQEFSAAYGKVRFAHVCTNLTLEQNALPPIAKPSEPPAQNSGSIKTSDGEATYSCSSAKGPRVGYVFSQTAPAEGLWQVINLVSYVTPDAQVAETRSVIEHCEKTFVLSPAWVQKQRQLDEQALVYQRERQQARMRQLSEQVAQFEVKMQAMQNQVNQFERGQPQRQSQFEAFDNVIRGVTPTVDPFGNEHEVMTGPKNSYWRNPATGETVNADRSPGPGWQQLTIKQ